MLHPVSLEARRAVDGGHVFGSEALDALQQGGAHAVAAAPGGAARRAAALVWPGHRKTISFFFFSSCFSLSLSAPLSLSMLSASFSRYAKQRSIRLGSRAAAEAVAERIERERAQGESRVLLRSLFLFRFFFKPQGEKESEIFFFVFVFSFDIPSSHSSLFSIPPFFFPPSFLLPKPSLFFQNVRGTTRAGRPPQEAPRRRQGARHRRQLRLLGDGLWPAGDGLVARLARVDDGEKRGGFDLVLERVWRPCLHENKEHVAESTLGRWGKNDRCSSGGCESESESEIECQRNDALPNRIALVVGVCRSFDATVFFAFRRPFSRACSASLLLPLLSRSSSRRDLSIGAKKETSGGAQPAARKASFDRLDARD